MASEGAYYAATEARWMMAGAIAFFVHASFVSWIMMRYKPKALLVIIVRNSHVVRCGAWALAHLVDLTMHIQVDLSALRQTKWHEYAVRFLVGGLITAAAGIIAKKFGPTVGGLFLAFQAIFPAGATLIEKHEKQRKENEGLQGTERGREAASAAGSAIGSVGLFAFADFSIPNWMSGCAIE